MNIAHLKTRILVPLTIVLVAICALFIATTNNLQYQHIEHNAVQTLTTVETAIANSVADRVALLDELALVGSRKPTVTDQQQLDPEAINADTQEFFTNIHETHNIDFLRFHDIAGNTITSHYDDAIHRLSDYPETLAKAMRKKETVGGIELSRFGELRVVAATPWIVDGKILGYIAIGGNLEAIHDTVHTLFDIESIILLRKDEVGKIRWERRQSVFYGEEPWDSLRDAVVISKSVLSIDPKLAKILGNFSLPIASAAWHIKTDQHNRVVGFAAINDVTGNTIGRIGIIKDVTPETVVVKQHLARMAILGVLALLGLIMLFHKILSVVEQQLHSAQSEVAESEMRLKAIFENASVGIAMMDTAAHFTHSNKEWQKMMGYTNEEFSEHAICQLLAKDHKHASDCVLRRVLDGELDNCKLELHFRSKDDREFWGDFSAAVVKNSNGEVETVIAVISDITQRKGAEEALISANRRMAEALKREQDVSMQLEATMEQLRAASEAAQTANRSKSEFLANMSHEIRTPMTAILGYTELLSDGCSHRCEYGKNAFDDHLDTISRNAKYLINIINDILDLSKIESGKLEIETIECDPLRILAEVHTLMEIRTKEKGIDLSIDFDGAVPANIQSDPTRIRQILINLVGNAIKFTDAGGVRITTRFIPPTATVRMPILQFEVADTGIGITPDQIGHLFRAFSQADTSTTRRFGGTGLGLAISQRLAHMLGGNITVSSEKDQGSIFTLSINAGVLRGVPMLTHPERSLSKQTDAHANQNNPEETPLDCRVLLVEDGPDNQKLISTVLKKFGASVDLAENGQIGIDKATEAWEASTPYDVILMDMQMPVCDGYTAVKTLRGNGYDHPIIALTASAMSHDRDRCMDAGCDEFTSKPIDRKRLISLIQQFTEKSRSTSR